MKKFAVAAAFLTAIVATPALAAPAGEGRVEVRGGLITGTGADEGTAGLAAGYDFGLGSSTFVGDEIAGVEVLVDGANVHFSAGGRVGAQTGATGNLVANGRSTFGRTVETRSKTA